MTQLDFHVRSLAAVCRMSGGEQLRGKDLRLAVGIQARAKEDCGSGSSARMEQRGQI